MGRRPLKALDMRPGPGGTAVSDDFAILSSLAMQPAHPYRLLDDLAGLGLKASRSTLYRRVDALVGEGLLEVREERGARGQVRRQLSLTARGRERVAREAKDLLKSEPLESPLFGLAVGCAETAAIDELPAVLRQRMAGAARRLTAEERALAQERADDRAYLAHERRITHLRADVAWLQSVLARQAPVTKSRRERGRRAAG
jgi:DNA-binding PadR family transcriptional regulator